jgi:hypothetical protein
MLLKLIPGEGFLRFEEDRAQAGNVWKLSYIEIPEEHRHSGCADELATYALRWMRDNNIKAHIDDAYLREQWLPKHQSEFRDCLC